MDNLAYEDYERLLNQTFRIAELSVELTLTEISARRLSSAQDMFSLFFTGDKEQCLEQRIYSLSNEAVGEGELFLVPVELSAAGYKYEAAFNRLIDS